jgi:hypothetical protein
VEKRERRKGEKKGREEKEMSVHKPKQRHPPHNICHHHNLLFSRFSFPSSPYGHFSCFLG